MEMNNLPIENQPLFVSPKQDKDSGFYKIILIIVGILLLLYGTVFYLNLQIKKRSSKPSKSSTEQAFDSETGEIVFDLNNLETVKKNLAWLDKQRDERGIYFAQRRCDTIGGNINCDNIDKAGTSGHEGLAAIYARFKYFQLGKDPEDWDILMKDINNYSNPEKISWVQNDFWNCSFMYDLWQSNLFDDGQKKNIERICWTSTYYLPEEIEHGLFDGIYQTRIRQELPDVNLKAGAGKDISPENESNLIQFLIDYSSYPSDFAARYLWKRDEKDLKMAKIFFNKVANFYFQKNQYFNGESICLLGISSIDLFKVTGGQDYLDFAASIYRNNLQNNLSDPQFIRPICGIFSQKLFTAKGDSVYEIGRREISRSYVNGFFDFAGYRLNKIGDGSFFMVNEDGSFGLNKVIRTNGLMSILLSHD